MQSDGNMNRDNARQTPGNRKYVAVYTKKIMIQLVGMGYKITGTFQNPNNPKLTVWVFKSEGNFAEDFLNLKKEVHNGRK